MQKLKVFISNIDKQVGLELGQLFRNDHIEVQNPNMIVGTSQTEPQIPQQPYRILQFKSDPNLVLRTALESDLVILDLVSCPPETELIIKYMRENVSRNLPRVIAISSFLTWMNIQSKSVVDKALQYIDLSGHRNSVRKMSTEVYPPVEISQDNYSLREPSHRARYNWELQNSLLELRNKFDVPVIILTAGLVYGGSYQSLLPEFETCIITRQPLTCEGEGWNIIPTVHISDFVSIVEYTSQIIFSRDWKTSTKPFYFAVDDSQTTQSELLQTIQTAFGISSPLQKSNSIVDSLRLHNSKMHLKVRPSPEFQKIKWRCRQGIVENSSNILKEFKSCRQIHFNWIQVDQKNIHNVGLKETFYKKGYAHVQKQNLMNFIDKIEKGINQSQFSERVLELILNQRKEFEEKHTPPPGKKKTPQEQKLVYTYSNHIFELALEGVTNQLSNRNVVSFLGDHRPQQLKTHTLYYLCLSEQQKDELENNHKLFEATPIIYESESFRTLLRIEIKPQQSEQQISNHQNNETQLPLKTHQTEPSVSAQVLHMKQYLIDNVMPIITEAIVKIQNERPVEFMPAFIEALRLIDTQRVLERSLQISKKKIAFHKAQL